MPTEGVGIGQPKLSKEDLEMLRQGLQKHRETTESAERTLKVVSEAKEIGNAALVEMNRQNERIGKIKSKLDDVDEDVADAQAIVTWFSLCWFVQCWDNQKKQPKYVVDEDEEEEEEGEEDDVEVTEKQLERFNGDMEAAILDIRRRRMRQRKLKRRGTVGPNNRVGGQIGKDIQEQTDKQNELFNQIENGIDDLSNIANTMENEVNNQNKQLESMNNTVERTNQRVKNMNFSRPMRNY
eukprot:TRINITY_DN2223_c3_g1_i1.p1 TRINITY_DN2223_c3_g1~~TRINITY_DN2223_c3_g1_i1.p1  ORF type:complete len:239 (+),score=60.43 TRINITY_DN2223_c3_g1_i1:113-829(+)